MPMPSVAGYARPASKQAAAKDTVYRRKKMTVMTVRVFFMGISFSEWIIMFMQYYTTCIHVCQGIRANICRSGDSLQIETSCKTQKALPEQSFLYIRS